MSAGKFDYLVNVSEAAFQSMVIATIESFLVPGRSGKSGRLTRQRETFGLLWGYETMTPSKGRCFNVAYQLITVLAEAHDTAGGFGAVICDAAYDHRPIPLHHHAKEHDTWFCTRGRVQVWSGRQSRVLTTGDFCYVPPNDIHAYQSVAPRSQFFGVIAPGGWEKFFEESGDPIDLEADGDTSFVLGSAIKHPHPLVLGYYSVHTSPAALEQGEAEINRIGQRLRAEGRL